MAPPPKFVVLDRDGVINADSPDYIKSPDEWLPIAGSLEAIARLYQHGFSVLVATNQSGLARGLFDETALARIHDKLVLQVEKAGGGVAGIFVCPHAPEDDCHCRKPATGLLEAMEEKFHVSLTGQPFVGDSLKDLQAAASHRMQPVLVRTGNGRTTEKLLPGQALADTPVFDDLLAATNQYLLD